MKTDDEKIVFEAIDGATRAGLLASAASITSGVAVATVPVKLLGLITIGTATAISWPVVVAAGVAGAVFGGLSSAMMEGRRQQRIREEFTRLIR